MRRSGVLTGHEQIGVVDGVDFLDRDVELKAQFNEIPVRGVQLPARHKHGVLSLPFCRPDLIGNGADPTDPAAGF